MKNKRISGTRGYFNSGLAGYEEESTKTVLILAQLLPSNESSLLELLSRWIPSLGRMT